jgi:hypothetical protein
MTSLHFTAMNWLRKLIGHRRDDSAEPGSQRAVAQHRTTPSLEEQIAILEQCGIRLRRGITVNDLLESWDRQDFATKPFLYAVLALGGELDGRDFERVSDNLWHFDTECIENEGDYVRIAERVRDLALGELPMANIADEVDYESERASLDFDLDGRHIHWDLKFEDDWVDPKIFDRFKELLAARHASRRLTYLDLGGQDCIVGCATPDEFARLKQLTGLRWQWMADA